MNKIKVEQLIMTLDSEHSVIVNVNNIEVLRCKVKKLLDDNNKDNTVISGILSSEIITTQASSYNRIIINI